MSARKLAKDAGVRVEVARRILDEEQRRRGRVTCQVCGRKLAQPATGRRRRYCSPRCRTAAFRARHDEFRYTDDLAVAVTAPRPGPRAPLDGFGSFAELDAWLEEHAR